MKFSPSPITTHHQPLPLAEFTGSKENCGKCRGSPISLHMYVCFGGRRKGEREILQEKEGDKERERKAESEGRKSGKFRGIRFQRKKQKSDTRMSLRSMELEGEVGIVTVRAKGIRALKEVKSRKVKTGYQLGHGQPWGCATNAKEPTRAPYDKHEGNREAFGYPSALRVVTISLRCTIHVTYA